MIKLFDISKGVQRDKRKLNILGYISMCFNDFSGRGGWRGAPRRPLWARPCHDMPAIRIRYSQTRKRAKNSDENRVK